MTKNIFITAVAVLLSVALCPLWAQNVSEDCKVGEFSAINLRSVGNIIFTQSDTYSCRMEGPFEYVDKTKVTVKGETLVIEYKQKNVKNVKNLTFYITAPDLKSVKIDGVGNFNAKETLKLKNVTFKLDGVGNCEVKKLHCDELELMVDGVGNMNVNVNCNTVKAKVDGVGNIKLSGNQVIMYAGRKCSIFLSSGVKKFEGEMDNDILEILPISGVNKYIVMNANGMEDIRLVK